MATVVLEQPVPPDPVLDEIEAFLSRMATAARAEDRVDDATRINRIAALEQVKGAAAGVQAAETVHFARSQVAAQLELGTHPREVGRGIGEQLAMAVKVGPWHGARRLGLARALWFDLPGTFDLLTRGEVSEYVAQLVATETSHLDPETRRLVDKQAVAAGLAAMSPKEASHCARRLSYQADPRGALRRGRTARSERRVTLRPAPDTMSHLSAFLPVEQGVACWASLTRHADSLRAAGDARSRDQLLSDTLVERLTGQTTAAAVPVEVELIVPLDTLLDPDAGSDTTSGPGTADLPGYGPLPGGMVADLLRTGTADHTWRRVFTSGTSGDTTVEGEAVIVGGDARTRHFTGWLKTLIRLRDRHCRHPYCTAPVRHADHIRRWADGGETTLTNGQGLCERHNYVKEATGWSSTPLHPDGPDNPIRVTTPTGHSYLSRAPDPP